MLERYAQAENKMVTRIYVSNKIKNAYKKLDLKPHPENQDMLIHDNSWNANYFCIDSKKCWVITHSKTRYTVFIPDLKSGKIKNFRMWFLDHMINQILKSHERVDLSDFDPHTVEKFIGDFEFYPTNNDKSCISYINKRIEDLKYWKYSGEPFENISFYKIGAFTNELGSMMRNGKSQYIRPTEEMLQRINAGA